MGRGWVHATIAIAIVGCQLDTSGVGVPSNQLGTIDDSSGDDDEDSGGPSPGGTGGDATTAGDGMQETGPDPTTAADDTTGGGQETGDATTEGTTTGDVDQCARPPIFTMAYTADTAIVVAPMAHDQLANNTAYVYSEMAEMGTATFQFDVPCADEYYFHAFVYDDEPGEFEPLSINDNGADSYYVDVEGNLAVWRYGCQTGGFDVPDWQWQPVLNNLGCVLADEKLIAALPAGTHTISFLNRESGTNGADDPGTAAAIQVVVVTNDPDYTP